MFIRSVCPRNLIYKLLALWGNRRAFVRCKISHPKIKLSNKVPDLENLGWDLKSIEQ